MWYVLCPIPFQISSAHIFFLPSQDTPHQHFTRITLTYSSAQQQLQVFANSQLHLSATGPLARTTSPIAAAAESKADWKRLVTPSAVQSISQTLASDWSQLKFVALDPHTILLQVGWLLALLLAERHLILVM
jgi:hypothetical protein